MPAIEVMPPAKSMLQDRLDDDKTRLSPYKASAECRDDATATAGEPPASLYRRLRVDHESRDNPINWGY